MAKPSTADRKFGFIFVCCRNSPRAVSGRTLEKTSMRWVAGKAVLIGVKMPGCKLLFPRIPAIGRRDRHTERWSQRNEFSVFG